jgi:hypothetical protein
LFRELYPKGFQGSKWAREKRGVDTTRRLQRHRDIALVQARKSLCLSRLSSLIEEEEFSAVVDTAIEVGDSTDMISKGKLRSFENLSPSKAQEFARSLFELLHGDGPLAIRFERFVDVLSRVTGKSPSWQLATVFLALVYPKEQLCVKPPTLRSQAACLGRQKTIASMPHAPMYEQLRAMALDVEKRLRDAGYAPRDLLDVYDFMETTLSAKALKRIEAMNSSEHSPTDTSTDGERAAA